MQPNFVAKAAASAVEKLDMASPETAQALFRRLACRPFVTGIPPLDRAAARRGQQGLCYGDVVEVFGESGSGKTEVKERGARGVLVGCRR